MEDMQSVYSAYSQMVYRYLLSLTQDRDLSEELTQETFYQAVRSIERFDGSCKISTWLCAIAKHQLYAYQRKYPPELPLEEYENAACASAEHVALNELGRTELLQKLHRMKAPAREVLYLRLFGDLSFREIGEILEQTENWARVTFYRGKLKLLKELEKNE